MMFDPDNPPTDYEDFKKEILRTIDDADIEVDEGYDTALFMTNRNDEGKIIYVEDITDQLEEEHPELGLEEVIENYLPEFIKRFGSKFFAFVFPGFEITEKDDDPELVCVLMGSLFHTNLVTSEVIRDEDDIYARLGPWESQEPLFYPNLVHPFRKSITYQDS